jgi:hypothetical protein
VAGARFAPVGEASGSLGEAIAASRPEETLSFGQQLAQMFSVEKLNVDASLITEAMPAWKTFWTFPAIMAAAIAVLFFFAFWDKTHVGDQAD